MPLTTQVTFAKNKTHITIESLETTLSLIKTKNIPKKLDPNATYLLYLDQALIFIGSQTELLSLETPTFTSLVSITIPTDIDSIYLQRSLINIALEKGVVLLSGAETNVPTNITQQLTNIQEALFLILENTGHPFEALVIKKAKPAKARHKWTKEVSEMDFFIDTRDSLATVRWIKRNQMLIKKGATMMAEAPLNKDGSVGFSAKMGDKIRSENSDKFKNFVTTEDILLKSVNEVGLFLYFAGTNSWLEMIDQNGKTLNEWTVVD